jgi:multicomponent K+:H+ antiporter subunit G
MNIVQEFIVSVMLIIGATFALVGAFGLLRLPDLMTRLHAPTKATTLGVGGALFASMLFFWFQEDILSIHELLITIFLFLTAPITANFLAKAYLHTRIHDRKQLPQPDGRDWASFDTTAPVPESRDQAQN